MSLFIYRKTFRAYGFILLLLFAGRSYGQIYPVQVTTSLRPPYSLNLSDYASPSYDRIQATLYMADLTKVNYAAKVRLVIRGANGAAISTIPGQEIGPLFLNGGQTLILTGADLNQLFSTDRLQFSGISLQQYRQNQALPEGIYQFQFEVLDYNLNVVISNVNSGFSTAWLVLNDPPIINQPMNNATIIPNNPQNILFQWTPRHTGSPNSAFSTLYDLQLAEIYPADRNPNDAMLTSPPIFQQTVNATSYNYTIIDPNLFPDKWYAFRVRARAQNGEDLFKNQGYSEVYRFYYGQECPVPEEIDIEQTDARTVLLYWKEQSLYGSVDIQYKKLSDRNWTTATSFRNSAMITDLVAGEEYRFRLMGKCANNTSVFSKEVPLTVEGGDVSCEPPSGYRLEQAALEGNDQRVKALWGPAAGVKKYLLQVEAGGKTDTYTVAHEDNTSLFTREFIVPNAPFYFTLSVECKDGAVSKGIRELVDLSKGPFEKLSCTLPSREELTFAIRDEEVSFSWLTRDWFDLYAFRYRELGKETFTEQRSAQPSLVLSGLQDGKVYEYQILYRCTSGEWKEGAFNTFRITFPVTDDGGTGFCFPPSAIRHQVTGTQSAIITWPKDKEAKIYRVYYRETGDDNLAWDSSEVRGSEIELKKLKEKTEYEYKICALCKPEGISLPSLLQQFNTADVYTYTGPCEVPLLRKHEVLSDKEAKLEWEPRSYYTGYTLEYRKKGNTGWMFLNTNRPLEQLDQLAPATAYEYHVSAFCGLKHSDFTVIDTFTTRPFPSQFVCGKDNMVNIRSRNPIASLKAGDKFTAADFQLTVKSFTSERPYNGLAYAPIPYLKNSTFIVAFENMWVNEYGQMYEGRAWLVKAELRVIDEKLAGKIGSFVNKLDEGLGKVSGYLTLADSIQTSLNEIIQTANEPVDWSKYEGWTAEQLFNEGKRLVSEGQTLLGNGKPETIAQAKKMMMEGIELLKMAAALGNQGLKIASKKMKDWLAKILEKMKKDVTPKKETTEQDIAVMSPVLEEDYKKTQDASLQGYEVYPSDLSVSEVSKTPQPGDTAAKHALAGDARLGKLYKGYRTYRGSEYNLDKYNKILGYIQYFSQDANAEKLATQIQTDLKDALKGRNIDDIPEDEMNILIEKIDAYIEAYINNKAVEDLNNGK